MEETMNRLNRTLFSLTVALVLTACEDDPTGPMQAPPDPARSLSEETASSVWRSSHAWVSNLSGSYFQFNCDDGYESEFIRLEGFVHHRMTLMDDGAGGFHFRWHYNAREATGTGEESGEVYRVVYGENETYNEAGATRTGTFRTTRRLTSTGSGRGFRMVTSGQYTVNANDELVVDREETRFECEAARAS
jgi:hypothetical protein